MTRPAFGGHLMATIICPRFRPCMATVRPGVMKKNVFDEAKTNALRDRQARFELSGSDLHTEVVEVVKAAKKLVDLIGADYIVSVGRGISKDVEGGIKLAEELAAVLGGVVGGSRATIDSGWLSADHQVGQTGKTVHPRCTLLWASPAPSSTRPVCRTPSASSRSTRMRPRPSLRLPTTASAATPAGAAGLWGPFRPLGLVKGPDQPDVGESLQPPQGVRIAVAPRTPRRPQRVHQTTLDGDAELGAEVAADAGDGAHFKRIRHE